MRHRVRLLRDMPLVLCSLFCPVQQPGFIYGVSFCHASASYHAERCENPNGFFIPSTSSFVGCSLLQVLLVFSSQFVCRPLGYLSSQINYRLLFDTQRKPTKTSTVAQNVTSTARLTHDCQTSVVGNHKLQS